MRKLNKPKQIKYKIKTLSYPDEEFWDPIRKEYLTQDLYLAVFTYINTFNKKFMYLIETKNPERYIAVYYDEGYYGKIFIDCRLIL